MITEHDLAEAIAECEGQRDPNANTCVKLAAFYTIRDRMYPNTEKKDYTPNTQVYSYAESPSANKLNSNTEFAQVVSEMEVNEVLKVMDELMETLKVLQPRLYNGVISKLHP